MLRKTKDEMMMIRIEVRILTEDILESVWCGKTGRSGSKCRRRSLDVYSAIKTG